MRTFIAIVLLACTVSVRAAEIPRTELYPARSSHFSPDERRAIEIARQKLIGGGQRPLDAFYNVKRKGTEFWIVALATGGRQKGSDAGFARPAFYTVVVSAQWKATRVVSGWLM